MTARARGGRTCEQIVVEEPGLGTQKAPGSMPGASISTSAGTADP
jgi:hypothetical protein